MEKGQVRAMKLLYATSNVAKLEAMRNRLKEYNIELIGLEELLETGWELPDIPETGNTPLDNARNKALQYYKVFQMPLFSCDSGLFFENVPQEMQPGVHVRTVKGKRLTDEEMIAYYGEMAKEYGDLKAYYKNAICLILGEDKIYEAMDKTMESERFLLTSVPHSAVRRLGFPLDSMSIDIKTGKYFYDLPESVLDQVAVEDGFVAFFEKYCREYR